MHGSWTNCEPCCERRFRFFDVGANDLTDLLWFGSCELVATECLVLCCDKIIDMQGIATQCDEPNPLCDDLMKIDILLTIQ